MKQGQELLFPSGSPSGKGLAGDASESFEPPEGIVLSKWISIRATPGGSRPSFWSLMDGAAGRKGRTGREGTPGERKVPEDPTSVQSGY
jgi:hypothetical protein